MRLSDLIEAFIKQTLDEKDGEAAIQRNELASYFKCVPSQINYVIATRFTQDKGYYVESTRGGGGSIRIRRIELRQKGDYLMHVIMAMGDSISQQTAGIFINNFLDYGVITDREAIILRAAVSDKILGAVAQPRRDEMRASLMKNILMAIVTA